MVDSILDNLSLRTQRRADIKLELDLKTSSAKLEQLLSDVKKIMDRKEIVEANVYLGEITGNAFVLQSDYYTIPFTIKEFNGIKEQVNLQIIKLTEELQIEIAGANTDIRVSK
jgi:MscS family membrane protein